MPATNSRSRSGSDNVIRMVSPAAEAARMQDARRMEYTSTIPRLGRGVVWSDVLADIEQYRIERERRQEHGLRERAA